MVFALKGNEWKELFSGLPQLVWSILRVQLFHKPKPNFGALKKQWFVQFVKCIFTKSVLSAVQWYCIIQYCFHFSAETDCQLHPSSTT